MPSLHYRKSVEVGPDGAFGLDGLPPGRYEVSPSAGPDPPYQPEQLPAFALKPGATPPRLELTIKRLLPVRGRVVDAAPGRPVGGVAVHVDQLKGNARQYVGET